jgi:galactose mutarotase-like enzyme
VTTTVTPALVWDRVEGFRLTNGALDVLVLPERGAEIHQIRHRELDYFWVNQPAIEKLREEPTHPMEEFFVCGFYTMFPNAGAAGTYEGITYESHGDLRNVAWTARIGGEWGSLQLSGQSRQSLLRIERELRLDGNALQVRDTLINDGPIILPYIYGLHPYHTFPLLDKDVVLKVDNRVVEVLPDRAETVLKLYSVESGDADLAEVVNAASGRNVRYRYDPAFLNHTWVWVNLDSSSSLFLYVASLLPCTTSTPAAEGIDLAVERDTARWLEPGESVTTEWAIEVT